MLCIGPMLLAGHELHWHLDCLWYGIHSTGNNFLLIRLTYDTGGLSFQGPDDMLLVQYMVIN